jgi:hypothetical protein
MSFGNTNTPEEMNDSYLTSEQYNLLLALDPKYRDKYQVRQQEEDSRNYQQLAQMSDAYDMRNDADSRMLDIKEVPSDTLEGGFTSAPNGGFAWAIPLIGALAGPIINGITSLIKGRGQPVGGSFTKDFFERNKEAFMAAEQKLQSAKHPKEFYRNAQDIVRKMTQSMVQGSGQDANFAKIFADKYANKIYPKLFNQMLSKTSKSEGAGMSMPMNNATLALPIIKYALQKMTGSSTKASEIFRQIKPTLMSGSGLYATGGFSFKKIFGFARKALGFAMPFIKKFLGSDVGSNLANGAISGLLGKFKIGDVAKSVIGSVANAGIKGIAGSGEEGGYATGFLPYNGVRMPKLPLPPQPFNIKGQPSGEGILSDFLPGPLGTIASVFGLGKDGKKQSKSSKFVVRLL